MRVLQRAAVLGAALTIAGLGLAAPAHADSGCSGTTGGRYYVCVDDYTYYYVQGVSGVSYHMTQVAGSKNSYSVYLWDETANQLVANSWHTVYTVAGQSSPTYYYHGSQINGHVIVAVATPGSDNATTAYLRPTRSSAS
ncbi:hypothetical protein R8Z50_19455 [Longispora sp. K20-0274]|uniref:hypothetical protein n=1 Tax=Longispora sp. K20-0274 TaxID=3088255 RepID=UPI00399A510C